MPNKNARNPKNRCRDRILSVEDCKYLNDKIAGTTTKRSKLREIEADMDKRAADIALTVSDMFKFMAMSAAMLPSMELDTGIMRLKIDDNGLIFGIRDPFRKRRTERCCGICDEDPNAFDEESDDDEEGLLYDGD